ncbi:hypothetical protein IAT40_002443 [Kwoniella sp. CBS 6097]
MIASFPLSLLGGFGPMDTLFGAYPAMYDTVRFFFAGIFFHLIRRFVSFLSYILHRGFMITARVPDNNEAFDWISHYISLSLQNTAGAAGSSSASASPTAFSNLNHKATTGIAKNRIRTAEGVGVGIRQDYSLRSFILEGIWPTGRSAPRDLSLVVKKQHPTNSYSLEAQMRGLFLPGLDGRGRNSGYRAGLGDEDDEEGEGLLGGAKLNLAPSPGMPQYIKFEGHTIKIVFEKVQGSPTQPEQNTIILSTHFATHKLFISLLRAAQKAYLNNTEQRTMLFKADSLCKRWQRSRAKPIRPWNSVILPPGVKEWIYNDAKEFMNEQAFYRKRGLPHRRGYLFYGVPGSGKSSLISALAAKLKLDIYVINLGSPVLNDDSLTDLLTNCPDRCILLMEDIDCAFDSRGDQQISMVNDNGRLKQALNNESALSISATTSDDTTSSSPTNETNNMPPTPLSAAMPLDLDLILAKYAKAAPPQGRKIAHAINKKPGGPDKPSGVTLSGLLNALDGVASSEGRLLFCTTNWREDIDPALARPGRCDVWIEFKHATHSQARNLFMHFYDKEHDYLPIKTLDVGKPCAYSTNSEKPQQSSHGAVGAYPNGRQTDLHVERSLEGEAKSEKEDISVKPDITSSSAAQHQAPPNGGSSSTAEEDINSFINQFNAPSPTSKTFTAQEIETLAKAFADAIPPNRISVSALTGYLVKYKRRPDLAVGCVGEWVQSGCAQDPTATMRGIDLSGNGSSGDSTDEDSLLDN